jgi:hypothetical protein
LALVQRFLRFCPGRQRGDAAFEGFGDFALEAVATERPAAICSLPERSNDVFFVRRPEAQPVFVLPLHDGTSERAIERVFAHQRIGGTESMRAIARSAPVTSARDHVRAHRGEFHVSAAIEEAGVAVDRCLAIAPSHA